MRTSFNPCFLVLLCTCVSALVLSCGGPEPIENDFTEETVMDTPADPYQNLSPIEFAERIGTRDAVLIDVRTPEEIAGGKIDGALEIDYRGNDFRQQLTELEPGKEYLVYCASGGRSAKTCEMLDDMGFERVYNLRGGYAAWSER